MTVVRVFFSSQHRGKSKDTPPNQHNELPTRCPLFLNALLMHTAPAHCFCLHTCLVWLDDSIVSNGMVFFSSSRFSSFVFSLSIFFTRPETEIPTACAQLLLLQSRAARWWASSWPMEAAAMPMWEVLSRFHGIANKAKSYCFYYVNICAILRSSTVDVCLSFFVELLTYTINSINSKYPTVLFCVFSL